MTSLTGIRRMRAAILVAQGQELVLDDVELPAALDVGQVLVRLAWSGVCGSQVGEIDGVKGPDRHLPHLLGHEGSGEVLEIGPGVRRVLAGDRVVLHWRKAPGIESDPPVYSWRGNRLNAGWVTTFNEYAVVSENRLTPVPPETDPEMAALFGCPVTTGFGIVTNDARLSLGQSVVVIGVGGVGLAVVQAAALSGAYPIVAVDVREPKLSLARTLGATHVVNSLVTPMEDGVRAMLGPDGADVVVENTGQAGLIRAAYELTAVCGRTVLAGVPFHGRDATIDTLALHFGKHLTGSHGGGSQPASDIPRYLRLLAAGRLNLRSLITDRVSLRDVNEAIRRLRTGDVIGRCLIQLHT